MATEAPAFTISPFTGSVVSAGDTYQVKLQVINTDEGPVAFRIAGYDKDFRPMRVHAAPLSFTLGPGSRRTVTLRVPFGDASAVPARLCAIGTSTRRRDTAAPTIGARICGKFVGTRLR
jgi:hypothetical protein